jgi:hypothetical protein
VTDAITDRPVEPEKSTSPHHASYILRCWTGDVGQIRARLIDVHSGATWPVADLVDLPALVRRLMVPAAPGQREQAGHDSTPASGP